MEANHFSHRFKGLDARHKHKQLCIDPVRIQAPSLMSFYLGQRKYFSRQWAKSSVFIKTIVYFCNILLVYHGYHVARTPQ
jgi:hypothetical protein